MSHTEAGYFLNSLTVRRFGDAGAGATYLGRLKNEVPSGIRPAISSCGSWGRERGANPSLVDFSIAPNNGVTVSGSLFIEALPSAFLSSKLNLFAPPSSLSPN
jgi:hypothetical protein